MKLITQYPFLLLLFGPPLLRTLTGRGADASLQGSIDIWVLVQIALWMGVGGWCALRILLRGQSSVLANGKGLTFAFLAALLSMSLFASAINSPGRTLTLAFSAMHLAAVVAAIDFAETFARSRSPNVAMELIIGFRNIALILLAAIAVFIFVNIDYVASSSQEMGLRVLGGSVAPAATTSLMAFVTAAMIFIYGDDRQLRSLAFIALAVVLLFLAKTRFVYLLFILSSLYLWILWLRSNRSRQGPGLAISASLVIVAVLVPFVIVQGEQLITVLSRGSLETLRTGSGRTYILEWAQQRVLDSPLGIGFISGFRTEFLKLADLGDLAGGPLIASRIGNAHNSFVEILIGAGWHALAFYVGVIVLVATILLKRIPATHVDISFLDLEKGRKICLVLFLCLVMLNMPNADFAIPGRASFAYMWFTFAFALGLHLRVRSLWDAHRAAESYGEFEQRSAIHR